MLPQEGVCARAGAVAGAYIVPSIDVAVASKADGGFGARVGTPPINNKEGDVDLIRHLE